MWGRWSFHWYAYEVSISKVGPARITFVETIRSRSPWMIYVTLWKWLGAATFMWNSFWSVAAVVVVEWGDALLSICYVRAMSFIVAHNFAYLRKGSQVWNVFCFWVSFHQICQLPVHFVRPCQPLIRTTLLKYTPGSYPLSTLTYAQLNYFNFHGRLCFVHFCERRTRIRSSGSRKQPSMVSSLVLWIHHINAIVLTGRHLYFIKYLVIWCMIEMGPSEEKKERVQKNYLKNDR